MDRLEPVQPFHSSMLPAALRPWIDDVAERYQSRPDFIATPAFVGISSLVGRQISIRPKAHDTSTVIPNLWGAIVGGPGLMKTNCLQEGLAGVHDVEKTLKTAHKQVLVEAKEAGLKDVDLPRQRVVVNDATVEALGIILQTSPNGVLMFRDELMGFISVLGKKGSEDARQFYLESWNGDGQYAWDRVTRAGVELDGMCISILGGIQPGRLHRHIAEACRGGEGADGFLQRFQLLVYPDPPGDWMNVDRAPNRSAQQAFLVAHRRLAMLNTRNLEATHIPGQIPYLQSKPEAQATFNAYREGQEKRIQEAAATPAMQGHLVKYRSLVPTLALLNHLLDSPRGGPVDEASLVRTCASRSIWRAMRDVSMQWANVVPWTTPRASGNAE